MNRKEYLDRAQRLFVTNRPTEDVVNDLLSWAQKVEAEREQSPTPAEGSRVGQGEDEARCGPRCIREDDHPGGCVPPPTPQPAGDGDEGAVEALARVRGVIAAHWWLSGDKCNCGWDGQDHNLHVAERVMESLTTRRNRIPGVTRTGEMRGSWICGRCGAAPEAHGDQHHVSYACTYDPIWRPFNDRSTDKDPT